MAMEIFKLVGSIFVDSGQAEKSLAKTDKNAQGVGGTLAGGIKTAGKWAAAIVAGTAAAATAAVGFSKQFVEAFADQEQLVGGVETLYKDSSDIVIRNAERAYTTAGMSANEYMETVTGFSASLLQSLGGDTAKAAYAADQALVDMSDNANKMGTSLDSIKNAYAGFAKQNYTMLDNLKLGYGGTKSEMERLLADAQEISGVEYNIDNLSDVYDAIHVIQTDLDITGTTALEAGTTISGSIGALKARLENLKATVGDALAPTVKRVLTLVTDYMPKVEQLVAKLAPILADVMDKALPPLIQLADQIFPVLLDLIEEFSPVLALIAGEIFPIISDILADILPFLVELTQKVLPVAIRIIQSLLPIISTVLELLSPILDLVMALLEPLLELLDFVLPPLLTVVQALASFLVSVLKPIIEWLEDFLGGTLKKSVDDFKNAILGVKTGADKSVKGLKQVWSTVANWFKTKVIDPVKKFFQPLTTFFSNLFGTVKKNTQTAWNNITAIFTWAYGKLKTAFAPAVTWFRDKFNSVKTALQTVWTNITGVFSAAWTKIKAVFNPVGTFFGGIWNTIKQKFTDIGQKVGDAVGGAFKKAINSVLSTAETVLNGPINAINSLIEKLQAIPGLGGLSKLNTFSLPRLEKGGVLEKGQVGVLEGTGAEAVVPLENNRRWIHSLAQDMASQGVGSGKTETLLTAILAELHDIAKTGVYLDAGKLVGALAGPMDRELGRISARKVRA